MGRLGARRPSVDDVTKDKGDRREDRDADDREGRPDVGIDRPRVKGDDDTARPADNKHRDRNEQQSFADQGDGPDLADPGGRGGRANQRWLHRKLRERPAAQRNIPATSAITNTRYPR